MKNLSKLAFLGLVGACGLPEQGADAPAVGLDVIAPAAQQDALGGPRIAPHFAHAVRGGLAFLSRLREQRGLGQDSDLQARSAAVDEQGLTHVRFAQRYRGVPVWGGEAIVHLDQQGQAVSVTEALQEPVLLDTSPRLGAAEALRRAHDDLRPRGPYARRPTSELVVLPQVEERIKAQTMRGPGGELNAEDIEQVTTGYALAYHVTAELENGVGETAHVDYLIDARSGAILKQWDNLQTAAVIGTGNSQYSGVKSISTTSISGGFQLRDMSRSMQHITSNLWHATSGTGSIFTDPDNTWGDGANYVEGSTTTEPNGQTAGVDAHVGAGATFDLYKNVFGRNGIDGTGRATYSRVHYSGGFDNAFWSDSCFCMTYGDGTKFTTLTALDVVGHEMTHGVTASSARLVYSGESGGLNESTSDIFGTLVEFYERSGGGGAIGNTGGTWTIGEQISGTPLRYLYKPSLDGHSPDAWSSTIGTLDVHYSSGPHNRMFYFLSQGADDFSRLPYNYNYSYYLPGGMSGIGVDKAGRIAYRALTVYETPNTNYAGARAAYLNAAADLYGNPSSEYTAVENAFAAINVGAAHAPFQPAAPTTCGRLTAGQGLLATQQGLTSCGGGYGLVMRADKNLVLSHNGAPIWASGTVGRPVYAVVMRADGDLVEYDVNGAVIWHSNTAGNPGAFLGVQDDGNMVIYNAVGAPIWATNTYGS